MDKSFVQINPNIYIYTILISSAGWKNPNPPPNPPRPDAPTPSATPQDPCRSCSHTLNDHVKHLQGSVSIKYQIYLLNVCMARVTSCT